MYNARIGTYLDTDASTQCFHSLKLSMNNVTVYMENVYPWVPSPTKPSVPQQSPVRTWLRGPRASPQTFVLGAEQGPHRPDVRAHGSSTGGVWFRHTFHLI